MALNHILFFTLYSLLYFPHVTISDDPCPYPCYPPPIGGSTSPSPPAIPSGGGGGASYPPPTGEYPNYPTPPYNGGDGNNMPNNYGPPPPDPIMPYFPFYYRKPPHKAEASASCRLPLLRISTLCIVALANLAFSW